MSLFRPNIKKLKAKHDVDGLIKALNYQKDGNVRAGAAIALGELGDVRAVEPLRAAVLKENEVWHLVIRGLGMLGDMGQIESLMNTAMNESIDYWERNRAVENLCIIGPPAVPFIIDVLKVDDSSWCTRAADTLGEIGDPRAVEPLIACFNNPLSNSLRETRNDVRKRVRLALVKIGTPAFETLSAFLMDKDSDEWEVKLECLRALGEFGGERAVESLIAFLLNEDEDSEFLVEECCYLLVKIGDNRAVEPLSALLKDKEKDKYRIRAYCKALGKIGDYRAVEPLITFYNKKKEMYNYAQEALCKIGRPAVEPLIAALKDDQYLVRQRAAQTLGKIGDKRALDHLFATLDDTSNQVRKEAKKALKDNGWKIEKKRQFPASLSDPIPDIEFVSLSEWHKGVGPGESYFEKALSQWDDGDTLSAAKAYKKALDLGLSQVYEAASRMNLGKIYFKQHDIVAAVNEFQKAVYISPQRASTAYDSSTYLALIYQVVAMSNDMQATIKLAKKAMKHVDYVFSEKAANEIQDTVRIIYKLTQ